MYVCVILNNHYYNHWYYFLWLDGFRCPNGGQVNLYGCNLLGYNLPDVDFPKKTVTSVQMVGGRGGTPGYVSKCSTPDMVFAASIKIYTDQETHRNLNYIDQITLYWSDGTNNRWASITTQYNTFLLSWTVSHSFHSHYVMPLMNSFCSVRQTLSEQVTHTNTKSHLALKAYNDRLWPLIQLLNKHDRLCMATHTTAN